MKAGVTEEALARQVELDLQVPWSRRKLLPAPYRLRRKRRGPAPQAGRHSPQGRGLRAFRRGLPQGLLLRGYDQDLFYKYADDEARKVYDTVLRANLAGEAAIHPGARFCDIDRAARGPIEQAGYGPYHPPPGPLHWHRRS